MLGCRELNVASVLVVAVAACKPSGSGESGPFVPAGGESGAVHDDGGTTVEPGDDAGGPADDDAHDADDNGVFDVGNGVGEGGGEGGDCPCENVLDGIYVLNSKDPPSVWFYDPPANDFSEIGQLGCAPPSTFGPPPSANSMAIDRSGNARFNYYGVTGVMGTGLAFTGWLYSAPLSDLSNCTDVGYVGAGSWYAFGLGYSVVGANSNCDELFMYNTDQYVNYPNLSGGSQLATWDEGATDKVIIGPTVWPVAELAGTGDGRLYAFATVAENESILVQIDKTNGTAIDSYPLMNLDTTHGFAFAFWGGDVFFFTESTVGSGVSKVTRLDLDENEGGGLDTVNENTGLLITGAGVSTCASFVPPG